jgi:processive 1,2-diacylglycerol beta-glucosyltransferase
VSGPLLPGRAPRSGAHVLVLTASYGSGHNEAARSLAAAFAARGVAVTVVDHFRELVHPLFELASRGLYLALLRRAPALWGAAYALGDRLSSDSPLGFGVTRLGAGRLGALLDTLAPDAVVSVHATPAAAMSALAVEGRRLPPHTTVVTDFVAHSQWIARRIDRYCVAADEVGHEFVARGIPRERVVVTGVPLRPEFTQPVEAATARRGLGLGPGVPVVLAMAGSLGSVGRLPDVVRALQRLPGPVQALVVAGRDVALAERLRRLTAGGPTRVLGQVDNVRTLMAAADLLVSKAGGMTLAEAMSAELPMLLYGSLPGQERRNERFAARAGVALVARSRRELDRLLERALTEPELLEHLRQGIRRARRPDAAGRIVDLVLESCRVPS